MLNKLLVFIRQQGLILPGDSVTVAVSGGADSVALLFALYLLREKLNIELSAAHFNHGLRGQESDGDEAFVQELCHRYDIPLTVGRGSVKSGKKGLEAAAREARYSFFATLNGKIATAHTADDNAETVLLHLIRGTGLKGLGAIAPQRGNVIRPMLGVTRQEVEAFLTEYCLTYRTDSSNETDRFLRNRLRHHVMPLLRQENPKISENLSAMALRLREDEQALQAYADAAVDSDVIALRKLDKAIRSRVLEMFLKENGVREPEAEHLALVEALVFSEKPGASAHLPGGVTVARCYDRLTVVQTAESLTVLPLTCPGEVKVGTYTITCEQAQEVTENAHTFTVPAGNYIVRSRKTGDEIRLSGGTKSLKKLYIDKKIPLHQRASLPVIADETGIVAVCGVAVDKTKLTKDLPGWQITIYETNRAYGTENKENQANQ